MRLWKTTWLSGTPVKLTELQRTKAFLLRFEMLFGGFGKNKIIMTFWTIRGNAFSIRPGSREIQNGSKFGRLLLFIKSISDKISSESLFDILLMYLNNNI